jgi:acetyl-CoA carboxylase carboxyl transferase subunit alpha
MLQNAVYSVISPEGCASILWRDGTKAALAAETLKITSDSLKSLGIIDEIIPEPASGAHKDPAKMAATVKKAVLAQLATLKKQPVEKLLQQRYAKFAKMGA